MKRPGIFSANSTRNLFPFMASVNIFSWIIHGFQFPTLIQGWRSTSIGSTAFDEPTVQEKHSSPKIG